MHADNSSCTPPTAFSTSATHADWPGRRWSSGFFYHRSTRAAATTAITRCILAVALAAAGTSFDPSFTPAVRIQGFNVAACGAPTPMAAAACCPPARERERRSELQSYSFCRPAGPLSFLLTADPIRIGRRVRQISLRVQQAGRIRGGVKII